MSKVLVIDDDPMILRMAEFILKKGGHTAIRAQSGEEGVRLCESGQPDYAFIDCEMPLMNGFETLRKIRERSDIPVCMMTGTLTPDVLERAGRLGAESCIEKPISAPEMIKKIG